jgi:hypothetical protein
VIGGSREREFRSRAEPLPQAPSLPEPLWHKPEPPGQPGHEARDRRTPVCLQADEGERAPGQGGPGARIYIGHTQLLHKSFVPFCYNDDRLAEANPI